MNKDMDDIIDDQDDAGFDPDQQFIEAEGSYQCFQFSNWALSYLG